MASAASFSNLAARSFASPAALETAAICPSLAVDNFLSSRLNALFLKAIIADATKVRPSKTIYALFHKRTELADASTFSESWSTSDLVCIVFSIEMIIGSTIAKLVLNSRSNKRTSSAPPLNVGDHHHPPPQ